MTAGKFARVFVLVFVAVILMYAEKELESAFNGLPD